MTTKMFAMATRSYVAELRRLQAPEELVLAIWSTYAKFINAMKQRELRAKAQIRKAMQDATQGTTQDATQGTTQDEIEKKAVSSPCKKTKEKNQKKEEEPPSSSQSKAPTETCARVRKDGNGRMIRPTLEECQAYAREKGYTWDVERFVDFYASKGWMVGKNPMKDWQSAMRNWERAEKERKVDRQIDRTRLGKRYISPTYKPDIKIY